jgi:hypothetical protein
MGDPMKDNGPAEVRTIERKNENDDDKHSHDKEETTSSPTSSAAIDNHIAEEGSTSNLSGSSDDLSKDLNTYYTATGAAESGRLQKLRALRSFREASLRQNFFDSQSLAKTKFEQSQETKDKIHVLEVQVLQLSKQLKESRAELEASRKMTVSDDDKDSAIPSANGNESKDVSYSAQLEEEIKIVTSRLLQLECDRAYGEHELRKRIHRDAYKAKTRIAQLKNELRIAQERATELEEVAAIVDQDFQSYREGTEGTIEELLNAKSRISSLEKELKELRKTAEPSSSLSSKKAYDKPKDDDHDDALHHDDDKEGTNDDTLQQSHSSGLSHRLSGMLQAQLGGGRPDARISALEEENKRLRNELVQQQVEFRQESMMLKKKIRELSGS